jgi:hypothetical protein
MKSNVRITNISKMDTGRGLSGDQNMERGLVKSRRAFRTSRTAFKDKSIHLKENVVYIAI